MKIKKFNENTTFSNDIFEKIGKLQIQITSLEEQLKQYEKELKVPLAEYLLLHPELQEDPEIELDENELTIEYFRLVDRTGKGKAYYSNVPTDAYLELVYFPNESETDDEDLRSAYLTKEDVRDFLQFFEDWELKNVTAKKYNI